MLCDLNMDIGSPAIHCNSGSAGTSAEPSPGNNRPPLFVFGQNQDSAPLDRSQYITRILSLSNDRANGNISSNSSSKKRKSAIISTGSVSNASIQNNIQQDGAHQLQQPEEAEIYVLETLQIFIKSSNYYLLNILKLKQLG